MLRREEQDRRRWEVVSQIACSVYVTLFTFKLLIAFKFFMRFEVNLHVFALKATLRCSSRVSPHFKVSDVNK